MRTKAALALCLLATGCLVPVNHYGLQVRLTTNPDVVKGCRFIGEVRGADHLNGGALGSETAQENAERILRNNAGQIGANVVLLSRTRSHYYTGATAIGEAYACEAPAVAATSSSAPVAGAEPLTRRP